MNQEKPYKIKRSYRFWQHPIRWWKDRKPIKLLNFYLDYEWNHGGKEKMAKMAEDMCLFGRAIVYREK